MSRRSLETLTDILVLVVSPVLVMILVASLAFFMIQCFYDGQFFGRLNFATGLFVMAAVLVARIAIEEGREYASAFALPLGVVTILSIMQYTDIGLLAIPLVLFIWWATDKLTWDCTVLDEQQDASGEGLLQTIGLDEKAEEIDEEATTDRDATDATSLWQRWINRRRRHHTPGVWVIYFGLAAIPLFGIGQSVLPDKSHGAGFLLLCTYVASALALLMITSFLQMRRYLIQRRLPFTEKMAATWLGTGGVVIIALMLLCLALPRPNTGYSMVDSLSDSFKKVSSRDDREASEHGMGKEGQRDDDKEGAGESEEEAESDSDRGSPENEDAKKGQQEGKRGQQSDGQKKSDKGKGEKGKSNNDESERDSGDDQEGESQQDSNQQDDEQDRNQSESKDRTKRNQETTDEQDSDQQPPKDKQSSSRPQFKPPQFSNPLPNVSLPPIPKLVYVLLVLIGILIVLYFYGQQILAAVRAFLRDLAALFGGRKTESAEEEEEVPQVETPRPFRSFKDPFDSGMASRLSPQQLVAYTFEALQAWAFEQHCPRQEDQTPLEFAGQISDTDRAVGPHARNLAVLYNQAAYAPNTLGTNALEHVQALWKALRK